jgi:hypothetical protein
LAAFDESGGTLRLHVPILPPRSGPDNLSKDIFFYIFRYISSWQSQDTDPPGPEERRHSIPNGEEANQP